MTEICIFTNKSVEFVDCSIIYRGVNKSIHNGRIYESSLLSDELQFRGRMFFFESFFK